jgi:alpha-N-arabinofuranosidase
MSKKTFARSAALASVGFLTAVFTLAQGPPAVLTIHADQPVSKVSPTLYGLMTEEINYSYDGGLYAEMVRNRAFHSDWSGVPYWFLVETGNAAAKMGADNDTGPSDALKSSMRLDVAKADAANPAGILNVGYWGFSMRPATTYKGSFYAKVGSDDIGPVTVSVLSDNAGKVLATTTVSISGDEWKQYTFSFKTGDIPTSSANHLVLTFAHPGTIWFNLISLFPPTYHDRVNGNRIDLMEKLAAMHPAFLRFPGGNYLEGDRIADRFDWKKTIGPLVDRPTHPSPWMYHSDDGMGLLEFLEWCEDLKMQPVLAVYAGYSLRGEHVHAGPDLEPYIQDALEEIEYVTGGPDTKWGAERVKDGHPAPFALTYVEIGNEDWLDRSGSYAERCPPFFKAIRAKYPNLQLIVTAPVKDIKPDVLDEHYYLRATQFFHDAGHYDPPTSDSAPRWDGGRYDKAERNGPKIFVGEWATREGLPTPNFGAALGDAAWMTGLERNSDIVIMAAYAPLLVRVDPGGMQWETDLIGYDGLHSYGSPSYYAQVMFAKYLGDQTLASRLEGPGIDAANPKFFYSITRDSAKKRLYLKVVNASSTPQPLEVDFAGAKLAATGKLISLSARDTQATNTLEKPTQIVPVETPLPGVSGHLHHTVPGYAIQVIQLDEQ